MQLYLRDTAIFVLREGVVEVVAYAGYGRLIAVDMHSVDSGVVYKVEGANIVDASCMVLMFVGKKDGVNMRNSLTQHLIAEIGTCIYNDSSIANLHHCRGA